jgi:hypothetical protein
VSQQLVLDAGEPIVEHDRAYESMFGGQAWFARCPQCRAVISRYDESETTARECGRWVLANGHHCRA